MLRMLLRFPKGIFDGAHHRAQRKAGARSRTGPGPRGIRRITNEQEGQVTRASAAFFSVPGGRPRDELSPCWAPGGFPLCEE